MIGGGRESRSEKPNSRVTGLWSRGSIPKFIPKKCLFMPTHSTMSGPRKTSYVCEMGAIAKFTQSTLRIQVGATSFIRELVKDLKNRERGRVGRFNYF